LNPITTLDRDNILVASLLYESLFVLDDKLNAKPLLCEQWSSEDNLTFTFKLKPDIAMSDGSTLTADDVVYSLKQAMLDGRFIHRFRAGDSFTSDGELTVTAVLSEPNSRFINLLDVPIIKNGSIKNSIPPGTGPYIFVKAEIIPEVVNEPEDNPEVESESEPPSPASTEPGNESEPEIEDEVATIWLERFQQHRDYDNLPVEKIYLRECEDNQLTELFDDGALSLLWDDPSDSFEIRINRLPEKHYYKTTALQFIGFNAHRGIMEDPDIRRAVSCSIDRQYIVDEVLAGQQAIASPLALSSVFPFYDKKWEERDLDPQVEMTLLLVYAGLDDYDEDSFLEVLVGTDRYNKFTVDFIVNIENTHRTQAAHKIADTLRRVGFNITVRELPWDSYLEALQKGDFDMYYGEIVLNADFDLSPLLLPNGQLNYGGTGSSEYAPFIDDFLAARTDSEIKYAAKRLCDEITTLAPFAPVLYKKYAMYIPMGAISGATPSQSSVFYNFSNWTIDFTMLR
jgi:peptide/nickel transport system substrate-binding protein